MNKTSLIFTMFLLTICSLLTAQNHHDRRGQIQSQKVAFLTQKMDLSVEEAERFWPIYNEYDQKKQQLEKPGKNSTTPPTEEESKVILESYLDNAEQEIKLKREFLEQASKVVSYQQLYELEKGEREFRVRLLNRYGEMRQNRSGRGR